MKIRFGLIVMTCGFYLLTGCESKEDNQIYSAQQCLNTATSSTVDTCVAKVAGLSSSQAYVIRCSADFIRQNITTPRVVQALQNISGSNNSGTNATVQAISFFAFQTIGSDSGSSLASSAVSNCSSTGSETLKQLALLGQMATLVVDIANLIPTADGVNPSDLQSWLSTVNTSTLDNTQLTNIGNVVQTAQPSYCGTGGQFEGTKICTDLNAAVNGGSDPATIAQNLLNQIKH